MKKKDIIAELNTRLQENKEDLKRHEIIVEAALKNKGEINKKILKHLPEGCEFEIKYSMYYIIFPNKKDHLIGWVSSTKELTKESLERSDSCHGTGSRERIETIETILNNPENLETYCNKYLNLFKTSQKFKKELEEVDNMELIHHYDPCNYHLFRMMGINSRYTKDIFDLER